MLKTKYYFYKASGVNQMPFSNSRKKHALSRSDGEDDQNSKIKAFDCTLRAVIGWKGKEKLYDTAGNMRNIGGI